MANQTLRPSAEKIGYLYPIELDNNGESIDGWYPFQAINKWRKVKLTYVKGIGTLVGYVSSPRD
jgi:hypothetical protein